MSGGASGGGASVDSLLERVASTAPGSIPAIFAASHRPTGVELESSNAATPSSASSAIRTVCFHFFAWPMPQCASHRRGSHSVFGREPAAAANASAAPSDPEAEAAHAAHKHRIVVARGSNAPSLFLHDASTSPGSSAAAARATDAPKPRESVLPSEAPAAPGGAAFRSATSGEEGLREERRPPPPSSVGIRRTTSPSRQSLIQCASPSSYVILCVSVAASYPETHPG